MAGFLEHGFKKFKKLKNLVFGTRVGRIGVPFTVLFGLLLLRANGCSGFLELGTDENVVRQLGDTKSCTSIHPWLHLFKLTHSNPPKIVLFNKIGTSAKKVYI